MSRRRAKPGEYRTVVPKKGVYIHVKKTKRGKLKASVLRRTKSYAKRAHKPRAEWLKPNVPERAKPTKKQRLARKRNIKKAQKKWKSMSHAARVRARKK